MSKSHGLKRHPLYQAWVQMRQRCNNPNSPDYGDYGDRGIKVCERWNSFPDFLADMGGRPGPGYTVGRKDNDGPYSPENCRWETRAEQGRNKRNSRKIAWRGETLIMADWAKRFGVTVATLQESLDRLGEQEAMRRAEIRFAESRRGEAIVPHHGSAVNTSKLSECQAREIKRLLALPKPERPTIAQLKRQFGVSGTAIRLIRDGINWAWLDAQ